MVTFTLFQKAGQLAWNDPGAKLFPRVHVDEHKASD